MQEQSDLKHEDTKAKCGMKNCCEKSLEAVNDTDLQMPASIAVSLELRKVEVLGLKLHDIDSDSRRVTIVRQAYIMKYEGG